MSIHPTAIIEDGAIIGDGCQIGAFCCIGPDVVLADRVELKSHVVVSGDTHIGEDSVVFPFTVLGEIPQDLKFDGEKTALRIGARNRIREHVTMNLGTKGGGGVTRVGNDGLFMTGCHVAHDTQIGDRVILVNNVGVAGHCHIEDDVIVGALAGVHQWVRIGKGAIIGGMSKVTRDVIPYGLVQGKAGTLDGLNLVGLKRAKVDRADISALRAAFKTLKSGDGAFQERAQQIMDQTDSAYVKELCGFILADSDRSFLTPE